MIDYNLTPNEMAKLETYNKIVNSAFWDDIKEAYPNMTDGEAHATFEAADKLCSRLYKLLGMAKIYKKMVINTEITR